ncbi:membrane protein insertion efficiency factor YidD [Xanthobacter dioxanivorans]|uniref:Putative membrane protein insertion efficiency factor n=1 Tax=Xanthobacter dioxanivorans TaxID=2528964 RepID=A0A974PN13_9HYPH|nr:membrane protein insertion efficiency factor YidD [Xanthobacter dioxanivorans]
MAGRETADREKAGRGEAGQGGAAAGGLIAGARRLPRQALRVLILGYRYTLSSIMGRQCRYLPTCSEYAEEAVMRHGALAGGVMATARICRCHPWGGHGYDPVPRCLPADARWFRPWRYGVWRMPGAPEGEG